MAVRCRISCFLILLLVCLLAGCGQATPLPPPTPTPAKPSIALHPCQLGSYEAQCGTLRVWENRAARSGRTIDLNVAVVKASGEHPARIRRPANKREGLLFQEFGRIIE